MSGREGDYIHVLTQSTEPSTTGRWVLEHGMTIRARISQHSYWPACTDAPRLEPSNLIPSLAHPALQPPSIVLASSISLPGYSYWPACLDAPRLIPAKTSPSLAHPALQPPSIVLDFRMLMPGYSCWSACMDAPRLIPAK